MTYLRKPEISFTATQEKKCLEVLARKPNVQIKKLISEVFGPNVGDGRSRYGKAIKRVLDKHGHKALTTGTYEHQLFSLSEENKKMALLHAGNISHVKIAQIIFNNDELTNLHPETRAIAKFLGYPSHSKRTPRSKRTPTKYSSFASFSLYWRRFIEQANLRRRPLEISMEYAWQIFEAQKGLCALTGESLVFNRKYGNPASLDRIDAQQGYIKGNLQWIQSIVNMMKYTLGQDTFINKCHAVSRHNLLVSAPVQLQTKTNTIFYTNTPTLRGIYSSSGNTMRAV